MCWPVQVLDQAALLAGFGPCLLLRSMLARHVSVPACTLENPHVTISPSTAGNADIISAARSAGLNSFLAAAQCCGRSNSCPIPPGSWRPALHALAPPGAQAPGRPSCVAIFLSNSCWQHSAVLLYRRASQCGSGESRGHRVTPGHGCRNKEQRWPSSS